METQLELNVRAKNPLVWLHSVEEDRSVPRIQAVAEKLGYKVFEWNSITGFVQLSEGQIRQPGDGRCTNVDQALAAVGEYKHQRTVFIFRDFHPLTRRMEQAVEYVLLARRVKDLYRHRRPARQAGAFGALFGATRGRKGGASGRSWQRRGHRSREMRGQKSGGKPCKNR